MKNKTIYSCIFVGIIVALFFGFYFGMYLPKKARMAEQQKQQEEQQAGQETSEIPNPDKAEDIRKFNEEIKRIEALHKSEALQKFEEKIKQDYRAVIYNKSYDYYKENNVAASVGRYKIEINRTGDAWKGTDATTFSIFKDGQMTSTHDSLDIIKTVGNLKFNDVDYFLLQSYSGGAHCCFNWQAITHENDVLSLGKRMELLHSGELMQNYYYFEKDGQLYFLMYDSSFAEFHTSFSGSVFFPVFYMIDTKSANFVPASSEFKEYYQQLAIDMDEEIEKSKMNVIAKIDFKSGIAAPTDPIFSSLTHQLIIRLLSDSDVEVAKKEFVDDCNFFFKSGMIEGKKAVDVANEVISKISSPNMEIDGTNLSYNQVMGTESGKKRLNERDGTGYEGKIIKWQARISAYFSQITGIKFCVIDKDHQTKDIWEPCDWFWASSWETMDADDIKVNPSWDGHWVDYILNYYKVPFDKNAHFYDEIYTVTGKITGLDCGVYSKCVPYIDIISITK
ncbi:MAG TPA: hypothetical protein DCE80_13155 [Ignavibacteriales bacterium]|nr:hypothetical protein [Ignavibacteriales bacterium]